MHVGKNKNIAKNVKKTFFFTSVEQHDSLFSAYHSSDSVSRLRFSEFLADIVRFIN